MRGRALCWVAGLLACWLLVLPSLARAEALPTVATVVVSEEDLTSGEGLSLAGPWDFLPDRLVGQEATMPSLADGAEISALGHWDKISVPSLWNGLPKRQEREKPGFGTATYRLRIVLPSSAAIPRQGLVLTHIKSAARVWGNGRLLGGVGKVGDSAASERPWSQIVVIPLPLTAELPTDEQGRGVLDLAIEVSNHLHFEGGIDRMPEIHDMATATQKRLSVLLMNAVVSGGLLLLTGYVVFIFGGQKSGWRAYHLPVLLAGSCLRVACTGEVLATLFPFAPMSLLYRMEYVPIYIFMSFYFYTLDGIFPNLMSQMLGRILLAISATGVFFTMVAPVDQFTHLRDLASSLLLLSCVYFTWTLLRAWWKGLSGVRLLVGGGLAMIITVFHDAMMYAHFLPASLDWVPLGVVLFLLSHAMVLDARALRALAEVRRLSNDLASLNWELERQLSERTRALENALLVSQRDGEHKARFLAMLAHELRTPLNAMLGMGRMLLRDVPRPDQAERLELVSRAGHHLASLLDEIQALSEAMARTEGENQGLSLAPTDMAAVVREVVALLRPAAEGKGLLLTLEVSGHVPPWALLDVALLRPVVLNLLSNAIKVTPRGRVMVAVERQSTALLLKVTDSGPGIPPSARAEAFEPFARRGGVGPNSMIHERTTAGGSGLSLTIAQRLARAMNGAVAVEAALNGGACFTVSLPLLLCEAPVVEGKSEADELLSPLPKGLRLLLVSADAALSGHLVPLLQSHGAQVTRVSQQAEGVTLAASQTFDVVLLDAVGEAPSLDAARRIRALKDEEKALVPLMGLVEAGQDLENLRDLAAEAGIDDLLPHPLEMATLFTLLALYAPAYTDEPANNESEPLAVVTEDPPLAAPPAIPEALRQKARLVFQEQLPGIFSRLSEATDQADAEAIRQETHRLKGSAATFGLMEISAVAASVERMAKEGTQPERMLVASRELLQQIERLLSAD